MFIWCLIFVSCLCSLWCKVLDDKPAEHEDISPGKEKMLPNERLLTLLLSLQTFWAIYTVYTAQTTKAGDMSTFSTIKKFSMKFYNPTSLASFIGVYWLFSTVAHALILNGSSTKTSTLLETYFGRNSTLDFHCLSHIW